MLKKYRLFTPGPTPLLPQAQTAMASYSAHHRTADFRALFTRVLADLKEFIGTKNDVLVLSSSGTGFMEASVSNLTSPGDRVLVLTAGKFGERWTSLAKAFGCAVETVAAPYGETISVEAVRNKLTPEGRCVRLCASNGGWKPRGGARRAHCERGIVRSDDACRRRSAGPEIIRAPFSSGRADCCRCARRRRFYRHLQTLPRAVWRGRGQR